MTAKPFDSSYGSPLEPIPITVSINQSSPPLVVHVRRCKVQDFVNSVKRWDIKGDPLLPSPDKALQSIATPVHSVPARSTSPMPRTSSPPVKHESASAATRVWAMSDIRREILPHLPRGLQLGLLPMNKAQWEDVVATMYHRIDPDDFQNYHARSSPLTVSVYRGAVRVLDVSKIKQAWGGYRPVIPHNPLDTFPNIKKIIFESHELTLVRAKPRPTFKGVKTLPHIQLSWADIIPSQSCDVTVESPYWGSVWQTLTPGLKNRTKERLSMSSHYLTLDIRSLAIAAPVPLSYFTAYFDRNAGRTDTNAVAVTSTKSERRPPESLELLCAPYTFKSFTSFAKAAGPYLKSLTLRTNPTMPLSMCLGDLLGSFDWSVFPFLEECCIVVDPRVGRWNGSYLLKTTPPAHAPGRLLRKITIVMQTSAQGSIQAEHRFRDEVLIERCTSPYSWVSKHEEFLLEKVRRALGENREYHLKCWNFVR